jgi:gamma-tubulin complex component 5
MPSSSHSISKSYGNLSSRPSSRTTSRTPVGRPSSSLSVRPTSSASTTRPQSRFSQHSRQARSRLIPICQKLVTQITGLKSDDDPEGNTFREKVDYAVKNLETTTMVKSAASVGMDIIDRQISGCVCRLSEWCTAWLLTAGLLSRHALKARINSKDDVGTALEVAYRQLKIHVETQQADLDNDIKVRSVLEGCQFI